MIDKDILCQESNMSKMDTHLATIACLCFIFLPTFAIIRCAHNNKPKTSRFHFVAACTQSIMKVIASSYINDLQACMQFAVRYRGMAINFSQREMLHKVVRNYSGPTCIVYDCPEFDVMDSVEWNTVFDYYSSYARPIPKTNVSCIPKVGVYQLHKERKNYTEAEEICEEEGGFLADITSEMYTVHITSLISSQKVKKAYIGLYENEQTREFVTSQDVPLNCIQYRAWAPGEPKPTKEERCGVVTPNRQWKAVPCKKRFPFICEISPSGPYRPCRKIRNKRKRRQCIRKFKRSFPRKNRRPKCGDPSVKYNYFEIDNYNEQHDEHKENNSTTTPKPSKRPKTRHH
ncbi:uncharacterized protein LOC106668713 [Cimex lectularius]|uniref:C-type lectin domain-containing protein n=1 Tax=Cimex lectularius TaxID=79782 RepID=A0A8I6RYF5_CIMLE|nr:uncharacterized protein LOC106668713 [Cimex lectularius]